jgi:hypothetical protein
MALAPWLPQGAGCCVDQHDLSYRILALAAAPQWIQIAPLADADHEPPASLQP